MVAMPTYVYRFVDTDETIEIQQSFTDDTLTEAVHPETGKTMAVKKVFQPVGVTFKGSGFYKTDSRSGKSSSKPAAPSTGSDSSATSSTASDAGSSASSGTGSSTSSSSSSTSTASSAPSAAGG
jgi:predicted nucleic acid-binding Zn ribbon protein